MKKKFLAIFTSLVCMITAITAIPTGAESVEKIITITSENFVYTNKIIDLSKNNRSFCLESELISPDVMIVGIIERIDSDGSKSVKYIGSRINTDRVIQAIVIPSLVVFGDFGEQELRVGDLLDCGSGSIHIAEYNPPFYSAPFTYLGNGIDIFGEDFEKVIRHEMILWDIYNEYEGLDPERYHIDKFYEYYNIDLIKGDVNVDDTLNVLDCLTINKNLLAGAPLCDYARLAADINENGAPDTDDSLAILKETLGITENFELM